MKLFEVTITSQSYKLMVNSYGCIHLLNTGKYCDNTRKYCGNTHEQFWCILKLVVDHYFEIDFQSWFLLKNLQNCFKTYKYCDNTCEYYTCRWPHFSSIGSILMSITTILTIIGSILASIEQVIRKDRKSSKNSKFVGKKIIRKICKLFKFCFMIPKIRNLFLSNTIFGLSILSFGSLGSQ